MVELDRHGEGYGRKEPFHPDLVRKLIDRIISKEEALRSSDEALVAAGELLGLFVLEAKDRASIEAECDYEATLEDKHEDDTENNSDKRNATNSNNGDNKMCLKVAA